jgi:hypothetical protein
MVHQTFIHETKQTKEAQWQANMAGKWANKADGLKHISLQKIKFNKTRAQKEAQTRQES